MINNIERIKVPPIAIIGGTGRLGIALATRFAHYGFYVTIGTRDPEKAQTKFSHIHQDKLKQLTFLNYSEAINGAAVVFMTVPYTQTLLVIDQLKPLLNNKILVDTTVPINKDLRLSRISAVANVQAILDQTVNVVSAFQTIAAARLQTYDQPINSDVLVCGNDLSACKTVIELSQAIGLNAIYCGNIDYSLATENMALTLININRYHNNINHAGIEITP